MSDTGEIILYQNEVGATELQVRHAGKDLWLTQNQVADLFETTKQNVSLHVQNIFETAELQADRTVKEYLTVRQEGKREVQRTLMHYNLDLIIAIGYRVNSASATRFRQWATQILVEYAVKGFAMNDARLKEPDNDYFDELLARIRDIRSSEKVFHRKVCDIFAQSSDYEKSSPLAAEFFATVQNKLHWAAHGHTAAEVVFARADATKQDMGLTNYPKPKLRKQDTTVGKNYLEADELDQLNSLVTQFFEFAEGQAKRRKLVTMAGWITKLNGILTLNESEVLIGKGKVSSDQAKERAHAEYGKYRAGLDVPDAFDQLEEEAKKLLK